MVLLVSKTLVFLVVVCYAWLYLAVPVCGLGLAACNIWRLGLSPVYFEVTWRSSSLFANGLLSKYSVHGPSLVIAHLKFC